MQVPKISVSEFKAKALQFLADTLKKGKQYILTKNGVPIARVIPFRDTRGPRQGSLKGLLTIKGDIVHFESSSDWESAN